MLYNVACSDLHLSVSKSTSLVILSWFWGFIDKDLVLASTCFSNIVRLCLISFFSASKKIFCSKVCSFLEFGKSLNVPGLSWIRLTHLSLQNGPSCFFSWKVRAHCFLWYQVNVSLLLQLLNCLVFYLFYYRSYWKLCTTQFKRT